ncbi:MAG: DUF4262 domain-containing protein [Acidimicrobiia bacterium]|nr:DUF4262 domain-containing protein [Acidimicrobiia bacterium]
MDARTGAWIDQENARLAEIIRRHGWFIQYVGGGTCSRPGCECGPDDGPPFAYTIGLHGLAHPELLIFGVSMATAGGVLNDLGDRIRNGASLVPGVMISFEEWQHRIVPEVVPNPEEILLGSNSFYRLGRGRSVEALQLTVDDKNGLFPWDNGCLAPEMQPRPGTFKA